MQAPLAERRAAASHAQRRAAAKLLTATTESLDRFSDEAAARAAGFVPGPGTRKVIHYRNRVNRRDGRALDPAHPEGLVFLRTGSGYRLLGAVFTVAAGESAPTPGGGIFRWHTHDPNCGSFLVAPRACESSFRMLHVWTASPVVDPWAQPIRDAFGR